ncbi:MAG: CvpA family protein [Chloroflexi bacterium]|nr:CvpA family protein [Chloroflexota bacterium]
MEFTGPAVNVVDIVALVVVLLTAIAGVRNGFINGFLDLLGLAAGVYLAFKGYGLVADHVVELFPLPRGIANLSGFIGVFVLSQIAFSLVFGLAARLMRLLLRLLPPLRLLDKVAGVIPGMVKGVLIVTLVMLPFGLFPIVPEAKGQIAKSYTGSRLMAAASDIAPRLESSLGQTAEETLAFLSRTQPGKPLNLDFPLSSNLSVDTSAEDRMLNMVNAERAKAGLQPLVTDESLRAVARDHSREMFEMSYFDHESPVNGSPADRIRAAGVKFTLAAENLAYAPNVEMAHSGLMNSPGHRKNILNPGLRRVGIGVIDGGIKGEMFTQNFTD